MTLYWVKNYRVCAKYSDRYRQGCRVCAANVMVIYIFKGTGVSRMVGRDLATWLRGKGKVGRLGIVGRVGRRVVLRGG